jgi:hypothetical protein
MIQVRELSTESTIKEILFVFGIEKISDEKYQDIKNILLDLERYSKWRGVRNCNNWIAGINPKSLTVNEDYIFNKKPKLS